MSSYNFKEVEDRWKEEWYNSDLYNAKDFSEKEKKYILVEFPYPSGKSMHVGHMLRYTVPEIYSRFLRMRGYNVMFPMGWDAFGLPAENYAIKTGIHPAEGIKELVGYYKESMKDIGYGIDWSREVNTTDPNYYKWTQWIFLKLWEEGLAELKEEPVWWSEEMKTVLAEEEVIKNGEGELVAERDGSPVERRMLQQWVLKIPQYADKLVDGLETVDFPESIKAAQTNWIGRSEGTVVKFPIVQLPGETLETFTTRIDTIFGLTFIAIAPEHEILDDLLEHAANREEVEVYIKQSLNKTELERQQDKEKSGVRIEGVKVKNPFDPEKEAEIFVADYVLRSYGTGIVMGVPAHDERDFQFAKKYGIDIIHVISPKKGQQIEVDDSYTPSEEYGYLVNSREYSDLETPEAIKKMNKWLESESLGHSEVTYKLRDWLFSRQRYWGEPIPLIHRADGSIEPIADSNNPESYNRNLPLELPDVPDYNPTDDGSSPLAANKEWVETLDTEGNPAQRETNTMPNWAGSCWYFLRYIDPQNDDSIADMDKLKYWLPVDRYFGGSEHTTLHLLYSRFWHKFLYDQGVLPTSEPYAWRLNGGTMLGPDGRRMSKSRGNVVEPQEKLEKYGADAVRMYIAFIGPYDGTFPYSENSLKACNRVLANINSLRELVKPEIEDLELEKELHLMIKKTTQMAEDLKMNTMVSEIMIFTKKMRERDGIPVKIWKDFVKVLAPIAPFLAEDLWQEVNQFEEWSVENSVHSEIWPDFDEKLLVVEEVEIPVQINGKFRGTVMVDKNASEDDVRLAISTQERFGEFLEGKEIKKFIYVPGKIANLVV